MAAEKDNVSYERRGAAAILRITRPQRRNAVDSATARELLGGYREFERDESARALIVTGDDKAFCAGWDLKAALGLHADSDRRTRSEAQGAADTAADPDEGPMGFTRVFSPKPTIAAVNGYCVAGGLEIALWCDLRIAGAEATFGCFERRWGVPLLDGGTQRLARVIGLGRALELILLGRAVNAEEALRIGLANAVVPADQVLPKALEWAELIASFPQETLLADREAAIKGFGLPLDQGLALERRLGLQTVGVALRGAAKFAGGAGRHGVGVPGMATSLPANGAHGGAPKGGRGVPGLKK